MPMTMNGMSGPLQTVMMDDEQWMCEMDRFDGCERRMSEMDARQLIWKQQVCGRVRYDL